MEQGQLLACSPDQSPSYTLPSEPAAASQQHQFAPRKESKGKDKVNFILILLKPKRLVGT